MWRRLRDGGRASRSTRSPGPTSNPTQLGRWFRGFVEVRDAEGAERALVSAIGAGASQQQLANMLFAAATDHRYLDGVTRSTS
jgi:hypothetical protein